MKALILGSLTAFLVAGMAASSELDEEEGPAAQPARAHEDPLAEEALRALFVEFSELLDPDSVQFRRLRYSRLSYLAWCGEMNAKNVYGGYTGWRKFAVQDKRRGRPRDPRRYVRFVYEQEDGDASEVRRACSRDKNYRREDW